MKKIFYLFVLLFLFSAGSVFAHQPALVFLEKGDVRINNPEISQAFYDQLKGSPRDYFIDSAEGFDLYVNLLIPAGENPGAGYSARIFLLEGDREIEMAVIDGANYEWQEFYEPFGRDYYLKGPEFDQQVPSGEYKIEVFSEDNTGKYVLAVGKKEVFSAKSLLNIYWQLPLLKMVFFKTPLLQFFLTPFGIGLIAFIGGMIILAALLYFIIGALKAFVKHNQAKTMLLTSAGMAMKEEIIELLQRPAYDISVGFITTASKPEEDVSYVQKDLGIMREMGFNVQEIDIEAKKEAEIMNLLKIKDIIFVEGGNTFYLLKAMRACNFEKVLRKLLKEGIVYIGASAGSMVAGRTIITSVWRSEARGINRNTVGLKNLKGLNLVPFDIFVHYEPKYDEIIKQKIKNPKKRMKKLRILTDEQAILVQGKEVSLIGKGEAVVV